MQKLLVLMVLACLLAGNLHADELNNAQALFEAGKYQQADARLNTYLKQNPNNAQARFLKGLVLVELNDQEGAVEVFTAMTRDYPELPEPYNNIAVIHAANGDYDRARMALQSALKTHPSYSTAYENLGDIYAKMASEAYQQALDLEQADRNKLQVKLSLIDNLFLEEPQAPAKTSPEKVTVAAASVKPARVAAPASKPAPEKQSVTRAAMATAESKPAGSRKVNQEQAASMVTNTIKAWAQAWSDKDVEGYLSYYADNFKPARGTAARWRSERKLRLTKPRYIRVGLTEIKLVQLGDRAARVELVQTYESNTYQDVSRKRLDLVLSDGKWKITREISI